MYYLGINEACSKNDIFSNICMFFTNTYPEWTDKFIIWKTSNLEIFYQEIICLLPMFEGEWSSMLNRSSIWLPIWSWSRFYFCHGLRLLFNFWAICIHSINDLHHDYTRIKCFYQWWFGDNLLEPPYRLEWPHLNSWA